MLPGVRDRKLPSWASSVPGLPQQTPEPGVVGFTGVNPAGLAPLQAVLVGAGPPAQQDSTCLLSFVRITVRATRCRAAGVCETRAIQLI